MKFRDDAYRKVIKELKDCTDQDVRFWAERAEELIIDYLEFSCTMRDQSIDAGAAGDQKESASLLRRANNYRNKAENLSIQLRTALWDSKPYYDADGDEYEDGYALESAEELIYMLNCLKKKEDYYARPNTTTLNVG